MIYWKPHSRVQRRNNKHYCQGKTNKTNYGSAEHLQEQNKKPDTDLTKYIKTTTDEEIRQGQGYGFLCTSLNFFWNLAISKPSTRC